MARWNRKTRWGALAVVVTVVAVLVHFGMALVTVSSLDLARQKGDADAFSAHVDYPRLRASFEATMGEQLAVTAQSSPAFMRPMVQAMAQAVLPTLSENLITPNGVAQIMAQGHVPTAHQVDEQHPPIAADPSAPASNVAPLPSMATRHARFQNLDTLALTYDDGHGRRMTLLVRAEAPFVWKLAGIEIAVPAVLREKAEANQRAETKANGSASAPVAAR